MQTKTLPFLRAFKLFVILSVFLLSCRSADHPSIEQPVQQDQTHYSGISHQLIQKTPPGIRFEHYTIEDGLSMSTVYDLIQDRNGYIWVATEDGLNRFDGYEFKIYRPAIDDPDGLNISNIHSLFEDRDGFIWLGGCMGGIIRYDPYQDSFQQLNPDSNVPNIKILTIYSIEQDHTGLLWFASNDGLFRYDPGKDIWQYFQSKADDPSSLSSDEVFSVVEDSSNRLWIGTSQGLDRFEWETEEFFHFQHDPDDPGSLHGSGVYTIFEDRAGFLWVGTTDGGPNRLDPGVEMFDYWVFDPDDPDSISNDSILAITEDSAGYLWIGTRQGLNLFDQDDEVFTRYLTSEEAPDSLSDDWVHAVYIDRTGSLWVGTAYGGVNHFDPLSGQFRHFVPSPSVSDQISENSVWSIYEDMSGVLWLGTNGGGLKKCLLSTGVCQHFRHEEDNPASLGHDVVVDIRPAGDGSLWLATWGGGLNRFDPNTGIFSQYRSDVDDPASISSDIVWLIYEDSRGSLWIGTGGGLNRFDPQTEQFTRYLHDPDDPGSISNDQIVAIYEDSTRQLWIGTQDGLNVFKPDTGTFTHIYHDPEDPQSISHNTVFAIHEDASGTLWFGTYGGGLNQYDPAANTFEHYRAAEGLVNDSIYGILEDDPGNLWISTNNGISKFDPVAVTFKNFGVEDGLQAGEFNFNAYFEDENGNMFFGGVNGVTIFHPNTIIPNPYQPSIVLQSISQGGMPIELDEAFEYSTDLTLLWPNNYFDFEFAAISYFQPEHNQHAYKLENFDEDWNEIGTRRFGRYTNLPGGTYTLRLKGSNNDGLWNEEGTSITIKVVPPIWQSWWFLASFGLLVMGVAFLGYRLRIGNLETRRRELEKDVEERTQEINKRQRQIEALYHADEDLYRHLDLDQVLQALVDNAVQILEADKGALLCWDEQHENLVIQASHNFSSFTINYVRIPAGKGVVGQVAVSGEPAVVEDVAVDPRVTLQITKREKIRSFIQVPIKIGGEIFGVFSADYMRPRSFSEDDKRLLLSLAQRAATAIQNAQSFRQASELAATQERNRLARELHDAVTQTLFSASLIAEALPALYERDPEKGRQRLAKLRQMSRGALAEMRALLLELRPTALVETSLGDLLRQLGEAAIGREGIPVDVGIEGQSPLPAEVHIALYRIAQEAMNNILKHARASQVKMVMRYLTDQSGMLEAIELSVEDDGRGFNTQELAPERLGLAIMRERAQSIGATLEIESQPGKGTQIFVRWNAERMEDERKPHSCIDR
jgi:signal transduction histidine kinase/ligand-binding sensor domain-containing protein